MFSFLYSSFYHFALPSVSALLQGLSTRYLYEMVACRRVATATAAAASQYLLYYCCCGCCCCCFNLLRSEVLSVYAYTRLNNERFVFFSARHHHRFLSCVYFPIYSFYPNGIYNIIFRKFYIDTNSISHIHNHIIGKWHKM